MAEDEVQIPGIGGIGNLTQEEVEGVIGEVVNRFPYIETLGSYIVDYKRLRQIQDSNLSQNIQSWTHDITFTTADSDTVTWSSGMITFGNGQQFSIDSGTTGNMSARTYIYLDTDVSQTALQITTVAATANGNGKTLVAVAEEGQALQIEGDDIADNTITATKLVVGATFYVHNLTWTASDLNTVSWSSGTLSLSNGVSYSISAGNTGDMGSTTYVYLDSSVSNTVLQKSTTYSASIGDGKCLLAICTPQAGAGSKALITPIFSKGTTISGDSIVTGTLTLTSDGVNLVAASGAITLNPGTDIELENSGTNAAVIRMLDAATPTKYIAMSLSNTTTGVAGIVPAGGFINASTFVIGDSIGNFNSVAAYINDGFHIISGAATAVASFPKTGAATIYNGLSIPTSGGVEINFTGAGNANIYSVTGHDFYIRETGGGTIHLGTAGLNDLVLEADGGVYVGSAPMSLTAGDLGVSGDLVSGDDIFNLGGDYASNNSHDFVTVAGAAQDVRVGSLFVSNSYDATPTNETILADGIITCNYADIVTTGISIGNPSGSGIYRSSSAFTFRINGSTNTAELSVGLLRSINDSTTGKSNLFATFGGQGERRATRISGTNEAFWE